MPVGYGADTKRPGSGSSLIAVSEIAAATRRRAGPHAKQWIPGNFSIFAVPLIGRALLSAGRYPVERPGVLDRPPLLPRDVMIGAALHTVHGRRAKLRFAAVLPLLAAALCHAWARRDGEFPVWPRETPGRI